MLKSLTARVDRARTTVRRATPVPFVIRCAILVAYLIATAFAWPVDVLPPQYTGLLLALAVWPAVAPRGSGATVVSLLAVIGWLASTATSEDRIAAWQVLVLSGLLYLGHTLTALAAVLPFDAVVKLEVPGLWLGKAAGVTLISAVLTVLTLGLTADFGSEPFQIATLVGLAGAAGATLLLARLVRRS